MVDLIVQNIQWCNQHGHPVLFLGFPSENRGIGIAISLEDAQSLAVQPGTTSTSRCQMYVLLEAWMRAFGVKISDVTVRLGQHGMTDTLVRLNGIATSAVLPARLADGVALAQRANAPLRMTQKDVDRLRASLAGDEAADDSADSRSPECEHTTPQSNPFESFIESLDLDGFDAR